MPKVPAAILVAYDSPGGAVDGVADRAAITSRETRTTRTVRPMPRVPDPLVQVARIAWLCVNVQAQDRPVDTRWLRKTIARIDRDFDPHAVGARNFNEVLESLERCGVVRIHRDNGVVRVALPG
ncbi:MAG: hypothetical protein FJZ01_01955 [Candidatus Sericytochromatia bacterium]|nr:hypothetical protein [Candidatus Tanganyikabacteria bacterium]